MEEMHQVAEGELNTIARPAVLFSRIDELEIPGLDDAETNLPENHQDNGATPPVNTQPSPSHSTPEYTSVASTLPPPLPRPRVEAGNSTLQARERDLPAVRLIGTNYMLYGVYQDWVHQIPGDHLDGGIVEESKCQAWRKNLFLC